MPIVSGGQRESGLDRALQNAFERELDDVLESGELWDGELAQFPLATAPDGPAGNLPWQFDVSGARPTPRPKTTLLEDVRAGLAAMRRRASRIRTTPGGPAASAERGASPASPASPAAPAQPPQPPRPAQMTHEQAAAQRMAGRGRDASRFRFDRERVGIVVIHGVGPQLAGQTLLDWTRPIIELLTDWREANKADLANLPGGRFLSDPVVKASIDFSGETFPTVQVAVPGLKRFGAGDPRSMPRRWVFTETWWAQEVRPPTLQTMIGWLGEQGGVARIVDGVVRHAFGEGIYARLARVSLGAFVSVIVSFVLLLFLVLLTIAKLVPFGPFRDAVILRLGSSFLTDWFGGARTLLRDPAQSANVRGRLVLAIKALRAYGCREVVVIAHSGGTMVSWMTLTDPAWPRLRVQKLITHGEALNLAWRLENADPDASGPATLPEGHRMLGKLGETQPTLRWRDFWATHDPAPSGRPELPTAIPDPGGGRFTEEKVWNRMSIQEDHGGYWDNEEHYVLPVVRELDAPSGDRRSSRFYDDAVESTLRNRRKQRVGLLALWRRVTFALPVMAILAAATMTFPGIVPDAGGAVLAAEQAIPGHELLDGLGRWIADFGRGQAVGPVKATDVYTWGRALFQVVFVLLVGVALAPARVGPLWEGRWLQRLVFSVADVLAGLGVFGALAVTWLATFTTGVVDQQRVGSALNDVLLSSGGVATLLVLTGIYVQGRVAPIVRTWIRRRQASQDWRDGVVRVALITISALVLVLVLVGVSLALIGMAMVLAGNTMVPDAEATRRFVLGGGLILVVATVVARVGAWRWAVWDRREKRSNRRRPADEPNRGWTYVQAVLLTIPFVLGAIVVAYGTPSWRWALGDRASLLAVMALLVVGTAMLGIARDVVDNDTEARIIGQGGSDAAPVVPSPTGAAAGPS